ncbi:MAG: M3 family metallopeptidase, partial [Caulobacteraceae bacterium]
EYLSSALIDMKAHLADPASFDAARFEADELARIGMPSQVVMRHRLPHFTHLFAGEGYAAGYYAYLWADALVADAAEAFASAPGGFFDEETARRLREEILEVGDTRPPAESFRRFMGRDVDPGALMRDRGFAAE